MAANIPVPNIKKGTKDPKKIIKESVRVGYYEILGTVGKGNFAVVKLAKNVITNSKVMKQKFLYTDYNFFWLLFLVILKNFLNQVNILRLKGI